MDVVWDGIRRAGTLGEEASLRHALADAARSYDWSRVFELISRDRNLVNVSRPGGVSLYAPLHQAAYGGAPVDVAGRLVDMGAWRTLQNVRGERPVDVADRQGHRHLLGILAPACKHSVPTGVLLKIQAHFHEVIRGRIDDALPGHGLRLPELEPLLELDRPQMWFPVPGMYGGFSFRLESTGAGARLISESWCRVAAGSGQRHLITSAGSELVDEGFV